jgi:predicted transport protein
MRHYLTIKFAEIPRIDQIYENFKVYAAKEEVANAGVEELVKDLRQFAQYFCAMSLGNEKDAELKKAFQDLKDFKVEVAYPFLLEVYANYKSKQISKSEFIEIVQMVESYAFRRAVVQIPTNSMNKTFARFSLSINRDNYLESVKAIFVSLKSYRRFPSDDEFANNLKFRDLYNFRRGAYWLRKLENFNRKELPVLENYSIEHILPQNEELNSWWKTALGENWAETQGRLLHTIGNLTLTRYNSEFSDRSFIEKRDFPEGGFKTSPLALNQGLGELQTWNEETILDRANRLVEKALKVWEAPRANETVLKAVLSKEKTVTRANYTYEDHKYLQNKEVKELFLALRAQILAIDSAVYEDVLKLYIAFKADTNFVDVIFKSGGLRLTINLSFTDLQDPQNRGVNIKDKGRWGNGEVSFEVDSKDDVAYAMFLIKQAYDRQFDGD